MLTNMSMYLNFHWYKNTQHDWENIYWVCVDCGTASRFYCSHISACYEIAV